MIKKLKSLVQPKLPTYDTIAWTEKSFEEKARLSCQSWAIDGYGTPILVYLVYLLKIIFYFYLWVFFCSFSPALGGIQDIGSWWLNPIAFQKAIAWSMLFEVLGLGCGSGPLTARYIPPIGGFLYFLRVGTVKMPLFENVPFLGNSNRNIIDVALYLALICFLVIALVHPNPAPVQWVPIALILPILGIFDKTIFLAARSEHYWTTIVAFAFAPNWIAGAMAVQLALWFFAGVSKLTPHFASVVAAMASNSLFMNIKRFRKSMYKNYPEDLNPSQVAKNKSIFGTLLELGTPVVLLTGVLAQSQVIIIAGIILMLLLHAYILSTMPMGVPLEWNIQVVYSGFFLFLANWQGNIPLATDSWFVSIFLVFWVIALPIIGNLKPEWVSFLMSMRYYAGNWACSVWLFRSHDIGRKMVKHTKSVPWVYDQLSKIYNPKIVNSLMSKLMAFRLVHLHGRAFQLLVGKAVKNFEKYIWMEGEVVAGMVLGYNFGDGHLHNEQLVKLVQKRGNFDSGDIVAMILESQPLHKKTIHYRVVDIKDGETDSGYVNINDLKSMQPWKIK